MYRQGEVRKRGKEGREREMEIRRKEKTDGQKEGHSQSWEEGETDEKLNRMLQEKWAGRFQLHLGAHLKWTTAGRL